MDDKALLLRIRALIAHGDAGDAPQLTEMEHVLTDGYARALALEAERSRVERRLGELARDVEGDEQARELRGLAARLAQLDAEIVRLRRLLAALRGRVAAVRAAAA